jgi:hypothetical protein
MDYHGWRMSEYVIELLTPEKFDTYWGQIEQQLDTIPHVWEMCWTKDFIRDAAMSGRFQCWTIGSPTLIHGVAFSQIAVYPARSIFQVLILFGAGMDDAVETIDAVLSKFAFERGCEYVEVSGRPGWEQRLKHMGFKKISTTLSKQLYAERMQ